MRAYSVLAHAHYLGKEMKAIATFPDGTTKPMLWIKDWDFSWQDRYVYRQPIDLPKGTKIDVTITYDNSADNPHNPCSPPRRVRFGVQSYDEMGAVVFQTMTSSDADEKALDEFQRGHCQSGRQAGAGERDGEAVAGRAKAVQGRRRAAGRLRSAGSASRGGGPRRSLPRPGR
jgi:hypothetical protein